jgi:hypothetical protein
MHRFSRLAQLLTITFLGFTTAAYAQETSGMPPADFVSAAPVVEPDAASTTPEGFPAADAAPVVAAKAVEPTHYGLAFRARFVSVPSWLLQAFAPDNKRLRSYAVGLEGFWRKRDREDRSRTWEIVVAVGYQGMSPPDGYWLGRSKDRLQDTDFVQAKGLSLITMDAAYVLRQYFSPYFGIHYGAGLGLGVVRGKLMRTSATCPAGQPCHVEISQTNATSGQPDVHCGHAGEAPCTETDLSHSERSPDTGPTGAHRFQETAVPSAIPIVNLLFGLDFPVPDAKGLEFRIEGGFYDAFFVGAGAGYLF